MDARRLSVLFEELVDRPDIGRPSVIGHEVCVVCAEELQVSGAGIMLMTGDGHRGSFGSSDGTSGLIEELQFTLGEGPCIDACRTGEPIMEPELLRPTTPRWTSFRGPVLDAGARAIFGFPIRSGAGGLGALDVYVDRPGPLAEEQVDGATMLTEAIATGLLQLQLRAVPGHLPRQIELTVDHRAIVHQAAGMVSAQIECSVEDALGRIRAYSYAEGRPIDDVARDIVDRKLRLHRP